MTQTDEPPELTDRQANAMDAFTLACVLPNCSGELHRLILIGVKAVAPRLLEN